MKFSVTTKVYNGGTVCGPLKMETVLDDYDSACFVFSEIDPIMMRTMRLIEAKNGSEHMEGIKIVTEMSLADGDGWDDLAYVSTIIKKDLSYYEYIREMARKGEGNA